MGGGGCGGGGGGGVGFWWGGVGVGFWWGGVGGVEVGVWGFGWCVAVLHARAYICVCPSERSSTAMGKKESQECVGVIKHEEDQAQLWYEGEADVQGVFEMWPL